MDKRTRHEYSLPKEHAVLRIWHRFGRYIAASIVIVFLSVLTVLGYRFRLNSHTEHDVASLYTYISQLQDSKIEPSEHLQKLPEFGHLNMAGLAEVLAESAFLQKTDGPNKLNGLPKTEMPKDPFLRGIRGYSRARIALWQRDPKAVSENLMIVKKDNVSYEVFKEAAAFIEVLSENSPKKLEASLSPDSPDFLIRVAAYLEAETP
jgi:hypothetical protein